MKTYNFINLLDFNITIYWCDNEKFKQEVDSLCKELRVKENDDEDFYYIEYLDEDEETNTYDIVVSIRNDYKNKLTTEWLDKMQQFYNKYNINR